jgi:hypothetical protein
MLTLGLSFSSNNILIGGIFVSNYYCLLNPKSLHGPAIPGKGNLF